MFFCFVRETSGMVPRGTCEAEICIFWVKEEGARHLQGRFLDSDLHFAAFLCWKRLLNKLPEFVNSRLVIVYKNIYLNIWDLHYK